MRLFAELDRSSLYTVTHNGMPFRTNKCTHIRKDLLYIPYRGHGGVATCYGRILRSTWPLKSHMRCADGRHFKMNIAESSFLDSLQISFKWRGNVELEILLILKFCLVFEKMLLKANYQLLQLGFFIFLVHTYEC